MKVLLIACVLLIVGAVLRHGVTFTMPDALGITPAAYNYMAAGAFETVLAAVIAMLVVSKFPRSLLRSVGLAATAIIALEGAKMPICRSLVTDITKLPPQTTVCDFVVGRPIGLALFAVYALILCYIVGRYSR